MQETPRKICVIVYDIDEDDYKKKKNNVTGTNQSDNGANNKKYSGKKRKSDENEISKDEQTPELMVPKFDFDDEFLSSLHSHPYDATITFVDEGHKYFVKWFIERPDEVCSNSISVTSLVGEYFEKFDADKVIAKMKNGRNWNSKNKYFHMSEEEIKRCWTKSTDDGTALHSIAEALMNGCINIKSKECLEVKYLLDFWTNVVVKKKWVPFRSEMRVRSDSKTKVVGSVDAIFVNHNYDNYDKNDDILHLVVVDWKRSKKIETSNKWRKGKEVCKDLDDCNFVKYSLQLSVYKYILEKYYTDFTYKGKKYSKVQVDETALVILHPNNTSYVYLVTPYLINHVSAMFNERLRVVANV